MGKNNSIKSTFLIGAIIVICTLVIFFVGFSSTPKEAIDYLALLFIVLSEIALFGGIICILSCKTTMDKVLVRSGISTTLAIYWVATMILSTILKPMFKDSINAFISIQVIIIAVVSVIIIALLLVASKVATSNRNTMSSTYWMQQSEKTIFSLKTDNSFSHYHQGLNKVYEELKYSDKVSYNIDKDRELNEEILKLYEDLKNPQDSLEEGQGINGQIEKILFLIKERNNLLSQLKRGEL